MEIEYPKINEDDFQKKIAKIYSKYKIKYNPTFNEICFPSKFKFQLPQLFVSEFINPNTPYKGLLLYHKIGGGKTCASIRIAEQWKHKKHIMIVCPASLIGNFYTELRSPCGGSDYITDHQRQLLHSLHPKSKEYKNLISDIDTKINKYYTIISYNKFVDLYNTRKLDLTNTLLIIDEVQNIISEHGSYYKIFYKAIKKSQSNMRLIIMSATPIFNSPIELALTINLLRIHIDQIPINEFNELFLETITENDMITYHLKNSELLSKYLSGYISYYKGAPHYAFPKKNLKIVKCKMSNYQYSAYKAMEAGEGGIRMNNILKMQNDFYMGTRALSNIAFPNNLIKNKGLDKFKGNALTIDLNKYSIKFFKILKKIKSCNGTCFIYSNFREYEGIAAFVKVLEANGFKNFNTHSTGKNRFSIWSGSESLEHKELTKCIFNKKENKDGSLIKIILGSPAIKEGVSLLRVQQVHILEPYWNFSRLDQIIGRAFRFCSHKDLKKIERFVDVYIYIAVAPVNNHKTVDQHILNIAIKKQELISQFESVIKNSAVDKYLFNY